jgi:hypothetical protein
MTMSETQPATTGSKQPPSSDTESRKVKWVKLDVELSEDILHKIQSELLDHIGLPTSQGFTAEDREELSFGLRHDHQGIGK